MNVNQNKRLKYAVISDWSGGFLFCFWLERNIKDFLFNAGDLVFFVNWVCVMVFNASKNFVNWEIFLYVIVEYR